MFKLLGMCLFLSGYVFGSSQKKLSDITNFASRRPGSLLSQVLQGVDNFQKPNIKQSQSAKFCGCSYFGSKSSTAVGCFPNLTIEEKNENQEEKVEKKRKCEEEKPQVTQGSKRGSKITLKRSRVTVASLTKDVEKLAKGSSEKDVKIAILQEMVRTMLERVKNLESENDDIKERLRMYSRRK